MKPINNFKHSSGELVLKENVHLVKLRNRNVLNRIYV